VSFELELQDAVLASLRAEADIAGQANGVSLERPVRASPPYLVLGPLLSADWGAKGLRGREVRLTVIVHDAAETWTRAVALQGAVARAFDALPRQLGSWSLGSVTLLRSRTGRDGANGWLGLVEYRVRAMETE
jgi:hypothetical protein